MTTTKFVLLGSLFLLFFASATAIFAQEYLSESNEVTTRVGNPTEGPGELPGGGEIPGARPDDYQQALIREFGVTMEGFTNDQYLWIWEHLHGLSDTRFLEYIRGVNITAVEDVATQLDCKIVRMRSLSNGHANNRELFTVVFTHEMGHIVYHCGGVTAQIEKAYGEALRVEGSVSSYGREMCYYGGDTSARYTENFAEMVAAYLNPTLLTYAACSADPNPFLNGGYPMHRAVAEQIFRK